MDQGEAALYFIYNTWYLVWTYPFAVMWTFFLFPIYALVWLLEILISDEDEFEGKGGKGGKGGQGGKGGEYGPKDSEYGPKDGNYDGNYDKDM
jgi:hypothetical protein